MERSRQSATWAIICIAILILCAPAPAKIIYVDDDAPAGGDGRSWQTAYRYLQDALKDAESSAATKNGADPCWVAEESVLGIYRFTGSGGSSRHLSTAVFSMHDGREYRGPGFKVTWEAGTEDIGRAIPLQIQGNPDPNAPIVGSVLTNGVCDPIAFQGGGGGRTGTDCSLFTKSPGVETTYADFLYHTVTRIDMIVNALKLDYSDASRTDMECDVTFAIYGYPDTSRPGGLSEIRVAQGVYKPGGTPGKAHGPKREPSFELTVGMNLRGGYAGLGGPDPNVRDFRLYETVLSGDLWGNDAPVADPWALAEHPTREDNSTVVSIGNGRVRLEGCTLIGGRAGAVYVWGQGMGIGKGAIISDCIFRANTGPYQDSPCPGALYTEAGGVVITRCSFFENVGTTGGALRGSDLVVEDCLFTRNYAIMHGGAAYAVGGTFTNCTFTDNRSRGAGALHLVLSLSGANQVTDCIFQRNRSSHGGALDCHGESDVSHCLFTGNEADTDGGAGVNQSGSVRLSNCVFAGNRAGQSGGAWAVGYKSELTVTNCTASANRSRKGCFLAVGFDSSKPSSRVSVSNCIASNGNNEIWSNSSPVEAAYSRISSSKQALGEPNDWLTWGPGNIDADPCFADLGHWDPNGTADDPNDDFWVEGDYHLRSQAGRWDPNEQRWVIDDVTSRCIDAGDPNSPVGDEPSPNGRRINMGAYGGTAEASRSYPFKNFQEMLQGLLATIEGQSDEAPLIYKERGYLHFIMAPPGTHFATDPDYRGTAEEAANWFQQRWRDLFVNPSNAVTFEVGRISTSGSYSTVRYHQKYSGLEVYAAEMLIQVGSDGAVEAVTSDIESDTSPLDRGEVSLTPSIGAAAAQERAITFFAERYKGTTLQASSPVLMIYAPSVLSKTGPIRLVWNMEVWSTSGATVGQRALVDAHDGQVVHYFTLIPN